MPSSSAGVSSTSARIQRAGAPVASVRRWASSSIFGLKSTPTTSSAPWFQSESVSRPPAHWRWMARRQRPWRSPISCGLDTEQVRAARADQRDGLVEPALIALGGLVPGRAVGGVHRRDVGELGRGRPPDQLRVVCHPRSVASGRGGCRRAPQDDDRDHPTACLGLVLGEAVVELGVLVVEATALVALGDPGVGLERWRRRPRS